MVIIGAGLAGSIVAYYLHETADITILTKGKRNESNSMLAQGGIASVIDPFDDKKDHIRDTLIAGSFHNNEKAVTFLVNEGPEVVKHLIDEGMAFDCDDKGNLDLGLEGAHSFSRILHAGGDRTGQRVTEFIQNKLNSKIKWIESAMATEWVTKEGRVVGLRYLDCDEQMKTLEADVFVLASGGIGQLFNVTSNDKNITGDGLAMTIRAGGKLTDLEFLQFHPTLLATDADIHPILISEAVRGAGAVLINDQEEHIMSGRHEKGNLAPRDIVSRIVFEYLTKGERIYLDISKVSDFEHHFPFITEYLQQIKYPYRETTKIPIQPGMHFMMGGVETDLEGRTSLGNLYAVGEVACTGVHGANRLASNSLLEILAFGHSTALTIITQLAENKSVAKNAKNIAVKKTASLSLPNRSLLIEKATMTLGIVRNVSEIKNFLSWLSSYQFEMLPETVNKEELEVANLSLVAQEIARAALKRHKSLGAHYLVEEKV